MRTFPKVSVITVNLNMADKIAGTLDSVLGQDYPNLESVVIDGGSTDGSNAIIEAYGSRLGCWISEPDRSLYDGMNKGVAAATGEWGIFMNAGDRFAAPDVLSRVFADARGGTDLLYGHHIRRYPTSGIERLIRAERPDVLPLRMNCSHQSLIVRRDLLLRRPFEIGLLAADYDFALWAWVAGRRFELVDCTIASIEVGGRSDTDRLRSLRERMALLGRHGLMTRNRAWHYRKLMIRVIVAQCAKAILPASIVAGIQRHRPIKGQG